MATQRYSVNVQVWYTMEFEAPLGLRLDELYDVAEESYANGADMIPDDHLFADLEDV